MPHPAMSPNNVAVVTGGASGIGLAAATRFARLGMNVCIADHDASRLREAGRRSSAVAQAGAANIMIKATDVSRAEDVIELEHAVRSFARTWLVDLKERKIRVNVLSPGTIDTPILDPLGPDAKKYFASLIPRGEIGRPEEIATAALFLASNDSSFVNGIELFVDGGVAQI